MKMVSLMAAGMVALEFTSAPALALSSRTFVSGAGSDSGGCGLAAPCRTFAYAITQTATKGEIVVLGSAGYGPVTITQAVSITNTSFYAGVTAASGNGITISAGASDAVSLRGLTIEGVGTGAAGIVFNSGKSLVITQSSVRNFVGNGIALNPTTNVDVTALITDTQITNNGGDGVHVQPATTLDVTLKNIVASQNAQNGIKVSSASLSGGSFLLNVACSNCVASLNGGNGVYAIGSGAAIAGITMFLSVLDGNSGDGAHADSLGQIWISQSELQTNHGVPWSSTGGQILSFGDNTVSSASPNPNVTRN